VTKAAAKTPVRVALLVNSSLRPLVVDGLGAVKAVHREYFEVAIRPAFADSLDLDEALKLGHEQENRWDYLLGHSQSGGVVAVEPHSAKHDEITTVIKKRSAAREQLQGHLRDGVRIVKWLWVASGKVHFADTEKVRRLLDQNGIEFVGTKVVGKHLPSTPLHRVPAVKRSRHKGRQ
jgi:hypothetical protein